MSSEMMPVIPVAQKRQWLIPGLLPLGEVVLLDGATGVGKSIFSAHLVAAVADRIEEPAGRKILYISSDDQLEVRDHFLLAQEAHTDQVFEAFYDPPAGMQSMEPRPSHVSHLCHYIREQLKAFQPQLVVIDALEELLAGNGPTEAEDWQAFWRELHCLARRHRCTLIIPRRQGLHEPRQYGSFTKTGTEMARFILTMHWHPVYPRQRILSIARDTFGCIGEQYHLTFDPTGRLSCRQVAIHEHVRPAKSPQTWQPDLDHLHEHRQIAEEIDKLMSNQPTSSSELKAAMKEQGYSGRALQRTLSMMKLECRNVQGTWMYLPNTMQRIVEPTRNTVIHARTQGAEVGAEVRMAG